jgi:hypothetical protein
MTQPHTFVYMMRCCVDAKVRRAMRVLAMAFATMVIFIYVAKERLSRSALGAQARKVLPATGYNVQWANNVAMEFAMIPIQMYAAWDSCLNRHLDVLKGI